MTDNATSPPLKFTEKAGLTAPTPITNPYKIIRRAVTPDKASCTVSITVSDDTTVVVRNNEDMLRVGHTGQGTQTVTFPDLGINVMTITLTNEGGAGSVLTAKVLFEGDSDDNATVVNYNNGSPGTNSVTAQYIFAVMVVP